MKRKICAVIAILCVLRILGLAGESDLGTMAFSTIVAHVSISTVTLLISSKIGGLI